MIYLLKTLKKAGKRLNEITLIKNKKQKTMDYKQYLNEKLLAKVKEQIEENNDNTFALVLVNRKHDDYEIVFDDLEINHNFTAIGSSKEGEYTLRIISGNNRDVSIENLKKILKDVCIDCCEIPLNEIL